MSLGPRLECWPEKHTEQCDESDHHQQETAHASGLARWITGQGQAESPESERLLFHGRARENSIAFHPQTRLAVRSLLD
jgi:hypothetical protein